MLNIFEKIAEMFLLVFSFCTVCGFIGFSYGLDVSVSDFDEWNSSAICETDAQAYSACKSHFDALDEDAADCRVDSLGLRDEKDDPIQEERTIAVCVQENGDDSNGVTYGSGGEDLIWTESGGVFYPSHYP